jgi:hypothetical protein
MIPSVNLENENFDISCHKGFGITNGIDTSCGPKQAAATSMISPISGNEFTGNQTIGGMVPPTFGPVGGIGCGGSGSLIRHSNDNANVFVFFATTAS